MEAVLHSLGHHWVSQLWRKDLDERCLSSSSDLPSGPAALPGFG